ncbi:MAG: RNA polymerase factor sigma-54 [Rhodovibrionaceae bacterium]
MALRQKLQARQTQSLTLTPQLQQSIKLLRLGRDELAALIEEELESNPLLRRGDPAHSPPPPPLPGAPGGPGGGGRAARLNWQASAARGGAASPAASPPASPSAAMIDDLEDSATAAPSLQDHLLLQAQLELRDADSRRIALLLIDSLDEAGYLAAPLADLGRQLGVCVEAVESVLLRLQGFEPTGVFARDLAECLRLQLREQDALSAPMETLLKNLDLLAAGQHRRLCTLCGLDEDGLNVLLARLRRLDPKPGARFLSAPVETVVPELILRRAGHGGWKVELNEQALPRLLLDHGYREEIAGTLRRREDKAYLAEQARSASFLLRALQQRAETLLKIGQAIVARQERFFDQGVAALRPLVLRALAEDAGLHESTVSRALTGKYMETPGGLYPLRYFLSPAVPGTRSGTVFAAEAVRQRLRALIAAEAVTAPLSDAALAESLRGEGIAAARRTVAKYRQAMGVPTAAARRRRAGRAGRARREA